MPDNIAYILSLLSVRDAAALVFLVICCTGSTLMIERRPPGKQSLGRLMASRRSAWMQLMAERDVRIMDATLLTMQQQSVAFYASAMMIAIGGMAAIIGNADLLLNVAKDLNAPGDPVDRALWELKLLFLLCLLVLSLLRFVWSHRLFGYCAILIGATPHADPDNPACRSVAAQAAAVNIRAGRSFNRGLRMMYFAMASLAWLLGPEALAIATLLTTLMLYRREFLSATRQALIDPHPEP